MEAWFAILGLIVVVMIWTIGIYNSLIRLRQHVRDSWSGIDTELRRRYDLIPNLVNTVKGYAAHEKSVLNAVTEARTRALSSTGSPSHQATDENVLVKELKHLFAISERYPDLKASSNFLQLMKDLSNTEDRIQTSRRLYNGNVRDLNTRIEVFPSNIVASLFSFERAEYFEIEGIDVSQTPRVEL